MTLTDQPKWKYAGHVGDADPLSYGGGFVYVDETGVYPPELTYFEPATDEHYKPISCDQCQTVDADDECCNGEEN